MMEDRMRNLLLITALLSGYGAGCGGSASMTLREPDDYQGCATDESWRTFAEQERGSMVKSDDASAASFTTPAASGMTLPGAQAPTFAWQISSTIAGRMNGDASCPTVC